MFLNEKEEKIISHFLSRLNQYDIEEMKLLWLDGSVVFANFDTCFEDDNGLDEDDEAYEEFTTFVFKVIDISGNPPVFITEDDFFCVNYRNFPDEILVDGKKIN